MIITAHKTPPVTIPGEIGEFLSSHVPPLSDRSILVITSKIVSILEGRIIRTSEIHKNELIEREADYYIEEEKPHGVTLTIKNDILIANAGVDESNGDGNYILWPSDPFATARTVWEFFRKKYGLENLGVIITDSRLTPLRWGTIGVGIAWCGFEPLHSYIGTPDIFGRTLQVTQASILDGLAASAVLLMGEGKEQTPLAIITDVPRIEFTNVAPTPEQIDSLRISRESDLFAPLLTHINWKSHKNPSLV